MDPNIMPTKGAYLCTVCLEWCFDGRDHRCPDVARRLRQQLRTATEALTSVTTLAELRREVLSGALPFVDLSIVEYVEKRAKIAADALAAVREMDPPDLRITNDPRPGSERLRNAFEGMSKDIAENMPKGARR